MRLGIWPGPGSLQADAAAPTSKGNTRLTAAASSTNAAWAQSNFANSVIHVSSGKLGGNAMLQNTRELAATQLHVRSKVAATTTTLASSLASALSAAAQDLCDNGFDFAPQNTNDRASIKLELAALLDVLGTRLQAASATNGDYSAHVFVNPVSRDYITVFVKAGTQ